MSSTVPAFFNFLAPALPLAIVWLVGIACALGTYGKHPGVSLLALLGCLALLLNSVGGSAAAWWMMEQQRTGTWTTGEFHLMMGAHTLARTGLSLVGAILLLVAVFGWRTPPRPVAMDLEPFEARTAGDPTAIRAPDERGVER
jgi:hypothetical protein